MFVLMKGRGNRKAQREREKVRRQNNPEYLDIWRGYKRISSKAAHLKRRDKLSDVYILISIAKSLKIKVSEARELHGIATMIQSKREIIQLKRLCGSTALKNR